MGKAFNLTAQIHLQGPSNVKSVVSKIRRELGTVKTKISLEVPQGAAKNLASINSSLNTLSRTAIKTNSNLLSLKTTLDSLGKGFNNLSVSSASSAAGVQNVSKSVTGVKKSVQEATKGIEDFGKQSGLAFKRLAALSAVTTVVYGVVNAVHAAAQEFVVFNKEMVRLSQVTGKSVGDLKGISDEITRLSTSFGVASKDLLTVATTLAQAGLSAAETKVALEALAKSALAPSFDSLAQTTEGVIASMRQFGLQGKEVEEALGSINAVSAAFAVEAGDIITAIQRTGGVFANSSKGVSQGTDALNEFIAVFTSIRATTRESAETIATGLRTIFTRVQRGDTIKALRGLGIELTDLEGKFVGPYEATNRLSEGLRSLDPRDLRFGQIVEELGGFRQIGKVIPLIQQYAIKEQALGIAQKGQTSISRDAITAQASLAIQFNKTRESFVALIREIGDSASFQAFATVSLSLTNGFINLASSLKPLLPLLMAFTAIKAGSVIKQYSSGFGKGLMGGGDKGQDGGGGGIIASLLGGGGGGSSGATARETQNQALSLNTSAINSLSLPMNLLGQNIILLNKSLIDNTLALRTPGAAPKLNSGGIIRKFARGGVVPGSGDGDTVPAMLEPGEFVIRKKAVETLGTGNLHQMNKSGGGSVGGYANGGRIQKFGPGGLLRGGFEYKGSSTPSIISYQTESSRINRGLLNNKTHEQDTKIIKDLDGAPKQIPPSLLYTGFGQSRFGGISQQVNSPLLSAEDISQASGKNFSLPGFLSASTSVNQAKKFGGMGMLNISTKGQATAIDVEGSISPKDSKMRSLAADTNGLGSEREFILSRNAKMKVLSGSRSGSDQFLNLNVQELARGGKKFAGGGIASVNDKSVYDGDTLKINVTPTTDAYNTKTRLLGVDAFEIKNQGGRKNTWQKKLGLAAKQVAESYYANKDPNQILKSLRPEQNTEKYGRILLEDADLSQKLISKKLAVEYGGKSASSMTKQEYAKRFGQSVEQTLATESLQGEEIEQTKNLGGKIQRLGIGGVAKAKMAEAKIPIRDMYRRLGKEGKLAGTGITDKDFVSRVPNKHDDVMNRLVIESFAAEEAIAQKAIEGSELFGLVGLIGDTKHRSLGPEMINGKSIYTKIGVLSEKTSASLQKQMEGVNASSTKNLAESMQAQQFLGSGKNLAIDFDETLVSGADIFDDKGQPDIAAYSDLAAVSKALQNAQLKSPIGTHLKDILAEDPSFIKNIRVLSARPQSSANLIASTLTRLGIPIGADRVTGVSTPGMTGQDVAQAKANNLGYDEALIDDNLQNILAARQANKTAHYLAPVAPMSQEDLAITGKAEIEGYTVQQILTRLGAPAATRGAMSMDFPKGLGPVAQFFGIEDNIPTDVKRTIDSSSIGKYREEVLSYLIARDGVFGEKNPKGAKGFEGLIEQVKNKGQRPGSTAQRTVGYIDSDVLAAPENSAIVGAEMEKLGMKKVSDYKTYLSKLAATSRESGSLGRLSSIVGVAGSGKSSLMLGGSQSSKADNASLRQTTRSPILTPEDISSASEIIDVTATVSPDRLSGYLKSADKVYSLSSSTKEEREEVKRRKSSRDITGNNLFGRSSGSTTGAPTDSGPMEGMLASEIDKKKLRTLGITSTGFNRKMGPTVETKPLAVVKGGFAPTTRGHESMLDAAKAMGFAEEDFVALVGSNEAITAKDPDAHDFRTVNFDQDFRNILAKAAFSKSIVNKADPGFGMPDIFEGKPGEDGRRHFVRPDYSSSVYMASGKNDKQLQQYKDKGYTIAEMKKRTTVEGGTEEISGTAARAAILSGDIPAMRKFLSPAVFDIVQKNLTQLQNRDRVLPEIMADVKSRKDLSLAGIDAELANFPTRLDRKKMEIDPAYKIIGDQVDALRERKKKIESHASFEPFSLLRQLAQEFPEKYGLSLEGNSQKVQKFAFGGAASDTVPALLTPGEFVINKKAAENIGYGKLNRMNKADKVQGFARGGSVGGIQRFKEAGAVKEGTWPDMYAKPPKAEEISGPSSSDSSTNSIMNMTNKILVISNVIQPMLTKFAQGLAKGNTAMEQWTKTVSETVEQASSFALSGSLAIGSVGGTQSQQNRAALLGGVGGAVSGGISAFTTVGLEKALLDNSSKLSAFDKLVEEGKNATSEQDRVKISKEINESFSKLNLTIKENIKNIDQLDVFKSLGESVATLTQTMIGAATVQLLLTSLEKQRAAVKVAEAVGAVAGKFPGGLMGVKAAQTAAAVAGTAAPAVGMGIAGVVGKVVLGFTRLVPWVMLTTTVLSAAYEGFKFFNKSMSISSEELLKFNERLKVATKNDPKNNINNVNFREKILPEAMKIINDSTLSRGERNKQLGNTENLDSRELNLVFIKQLNEDLMNAGFGTDFKNPVKSGDLQEMNNIAKSTEQTFLRTMALENLITGGMSKDLAENKLKGMSKPDIRTLGTQQSGKSNVELFTEQHRLLMNQKVQKSTLELVDIMNRLNDSIKYIGITSQESVKDLNNVADILSGTFQIQSNSAEKDVSKLSNLQALKPDEFKGVLERSLSLLGITDKTDLKTSNTSPVNDQMIGLVRGTTEIRKNLPEILRTASAVDGGNLEAGTADRIKVNIEALLKSLKLDKDTRDGIVAQATGAVQAGAGKGTLLNMDDLLKEVPSLGMAFETSTKITTALQSAQEEYLKTIESLNGVTNRMIGISSRINEANSKSILKKSQESIEMKEIFGDVISLRERNSGFEDSIKSLTKNRNNPEGLSDVGSIVAAIRETEKELIAVNNGAITEDTANQQVALGTTINVLHSALEQMANSGVKASNALNKIAEIQKTMASRLSLFERLATGDMSALIDVQRNVNDYQTAINPNTSAQQIRQMDPKRLFEGLRTIIQMFPGNDQALTDKLIKAIGRLDPTGEFEKMLVKENNIPFNQATGELNNARSQADQANKVRNDNLGVELDYLKNNTILQTFQTEMSKVTVGIVNEMAIVQKAIAEANKKDVVQKVDEVSDGGEMVRAKALITNNKPPVEQYQPGPAPAIMRATGKLYDWYLNKLETSFRGAPSSTPNSMNNGQTRLSLEAQLKQDRLNKQKNIDSNSFMGLVTGDYFSRLPELSADAVQAIRKSIKELESSQTKPPITTSPSYVPTRTPIVPGTITNRNQLPTTPLPMPSPPSPYSPNQTNLQPKSQPQNSPSPVSNEGAALLKGTADLKLVISSLANVFPTLNDPINKFKSSVDNLLKGLSDFNANGGIKGPNIPESVVVNVKFDEKLAIDTTSMRNEDLLSQIGVITRDAIATKWKELTRVNG